MTTAPVDATLYDKLEAVCRDRQVGEMHLSRVEIKRALAANPALRNKYFSE